jgi:flagellar hook-associated protein FlgK
MTIGSVINAGVQGMQKSQSSMLDSANQIARGGTIEASSNSGATEYQSMIEPMVNLKQEQHVFDASAKVVQTGSDIIGSLLDIKA